MGGSNAELNVTRLPKDAQRLIFKWLDRESLLRYEDVDGLFSSAPLGPPNVSRSPPTFRFF